MVLVQKWPFFQLFFLANISQENILYDILERKTPFQAIKKRSSKSRKIDSFPKGLTRGFGPNMAIFPIFFRQYRSKYGHFSNLFCLGNIGKKNVFYDIIERENAFLGYKNKQFKKSENWRFSKGVNPWFWSKYGYFFNLFFRQ